MIQKYSKHMEGEAELVLPTITFDSELYFPEDQIRLVYTPGHTIDSISVIDESEKVIHVGDNIGDTLDELVPSLAVSKEDYRKTLLQYQAMDFDTCLSGHNIVLDKQVIGQILDLL